MERAAVRPERPGRRKLKASVLGSISTFSWAVALLLATDMLATAIGLVAIQESAPNLANQGSALPGFSCGSEQTVIFEV